jgi:hypothetical protein
VHIVVVTMVSVVLAQVAIALSGLLFVVLLAVAFASPLGEPVAFESEILAVDVRKLVGADIDKLGDEERLVMLLEVPVLVLMVVGAAITPPATAIGILPRASEDDDMPPEVALQLLTI